MGYWHMQMNGVTKAGDGWHDKTKETGNHLPRPELNVCFYWTSWVRGTCWWEAPCMHKES